MKRYILGITCALLGCISMFIMPACLPNGTQCHDWYADQVYLIELLNSDVVSADPDVIHQIQLDIANDAFNYQAYCMIG